MKQHKVIVEVIERVPRGAFTHESKHIATYERVYPNKLAAKNNACEIALSKVFKRYRNGKGEVCQRFAFKVYIEDANGNSMPVVNYMACNQLDVSESEIANYHDLTADDGIAMLKARCFKMLML